MKIDFGGKKIGFLSHISETRLYRGFQRGSKNMDFEQRGVPRCKDFLLPKKNFSCGLSGRNQNEIFITFR